MCSENQLSHEDPASGAEVRTALLRLLRLLAAEVSHRLSALSGSERDGSPRHTRITEARVSDEQDLRRTAGQKDSPERGTRASRSSANAQ
jgi:hypothetical protein